MYKTKPTRTPLNISTPPDDPVRACNYVELHALWDELRARLDAGRDMSPTEFADWDAKVLELLEPLEKVRFRKPPQPHIPLNTDNEQYARKYHLFLILWTRHRLEKLMDDTGA